MRLIAAEVLRARSRRATWIILAGLVGLCFIFLVGNFASTKMPDAAETARAQTQYEADLAMWQQSHQADYAGCVEGAKEQGVSAEDWGCEGILEPPKLQYYTWIPDGFAERVGSETSGLLSLAAALMVLLGASLTAAEFSTGSLGNWLTFAPRRTPVFFSKLASAAVVAFGAAVLVAALGILGTAAWTSLRGIPSDAPLDTAKLAGVVARSVGVVIVGGAVGAALGALLRHTAAVIGVVGGYFVVVEAVFAGMFWQSGLHRWFLSTQLSAVMNGKASYYIEVCKPDPDGYMACESIEKFVTGGEAAVFLGAVVTLLIVLSWVVFRRRDVH
ncbi:ABC transporter permease subunit [Sanguibacter sp. A247]|uniref:ABC transporter permease subunit n=1 Tax=unclassified Sanguibacter TaxID=2645534 RepID=UPI003FD74A1D